jgi:hypothetical protein
MSNSTVPIKEFHLELSDLTYTGHDLVRPESVLAQPNGTLWTSDGRGGVTRINPDGSQQFIGGLGGNEANGLSRLTGDEHSSNLPITSGRITHAALEIARFIWRDYKRGKNETCAQR